MTTHALQSRGTWELVRDRQFGPYFWGNVVSNTGVWANNVAAVVLVFQITGSAMQVGLVTILQFSGAVFLAPLGGAMADRWDRRLVMIVAQAVSGLAAAALALGVLLSGPDGLAEPWPVFLAVFIIGVALAINDPARHALVPALVPAADMGQAIALNTVTFNIGRAVGPAVAGMLLASTGPAVVFALTAVAYMVFVAALWVIRPLAELAPHDGDRRIGAGVRHVWADKRKLALLLGVGAAGFGSDPVITLAPLVADELLGTGRAALGVDSSEMAVGVLASAFGGGAVLTITVLMWLHVRLGHRRVGLGGLTLLAVATAGLAVAPNLLIGSGALVLAGIGYFLAITSLTTLLQTTVPEHLRGRVMALWGVCFLGSRPVAAFVDASLASLFSARWALVGVCVVVGVAAVAVGRATVEPQPLGAGTA